MSTDCVSSDKHGVLEWDSKDRPHMSVAHVTVDDQLPHIESLCMSQHSACSPGPCSTAACSICSSTFCAHILIPQFCACTQQRPRAHASFKALGGPPPHKHSTANNLAHHPPLLSSPSSSWSGWVTQQGPGCQQSCSQRGTQTAEHRPCSSRCPYKSAAQQAASRAADICAGTSK